MTDTKPARNAIGIRSATSRLEASQRLVHLPLELGVERDASVRGRIPGRGRRLAATAPPPYANPEHRGPGRHAAERQPPREQVEAAPGRRGEDRLAEVGDELALDLVGRLAPRDAGADVHADALGHG